MLQFPIYININKVSIKFQIATLAEKKIIFLIYNWLIKYFFYINLYYLEIYINCYFTLKFFFIKFQNFFSDFTKKNLYINI